MSKSKKRKLVDSNPAKKATDVKSYKEEGLGDVDECRRYLLLYDKLGLTLYLRKLSIAAKMAANALDYSEHLQGNTLEKFIDPSPAASE